MSTSTDRLLVMPKLGLTMTEGAIAEWSIAPGARFAAGDVLFIVESDKAAVEFDAPAAGVLQEILVAIGTNVPVGTEIGRWLLDATPQQADPGAAATAPATLAVAANDPLVAALRILATPLARRLARAAGIGLATLTGSGPRGRIQAADVQAAGSQRDSNRPTQATVAAPAAMPTPAATAAALPPAARSRSTPSVTHTHTHAHTHGRVEALTPIQRTMAARVCESKQTIPHFYLSIDVDASTLLDLRRDLNALPDRPRCTVTHLLIAAVVEALRRVPAMNRVWTEDGMLTLPTLDVGLAVDTSRGLMSPVVHDLGKAGFFGLVRSANSVVERARTGALRPSDLQGGAMTISNAGMHDVRYMSSIIVPGQSAILGIGAVQQCFRPDEQGQPVLRREIGIVLSADHRIHTGVSALGFLNAFKSVLQSPLALLAGL